jgi:uncharacterized protein CbrC (UPF0167 family)
MDRREELFRISDAEAQRLIKFYADAEVEILAEINRGLRRGNNIQYLQGMLKNVKAILEQLRAGSRTWCEQAIPRIYTEGMKNADKQLTLTQITPPAITAESVAAGFGAIHQQAAAVLAENVYGRFNQVVDFIGRRVDDIYREMALQAVRGTVAGYSTWQQAAKKFRTDLADKGITGFVDRSGREWDMRRYSEMVARTSTMEAHLQGTANRLLENGRDLVKVSKHANPCKKCVPWEGKILSITGKTPGYKTLDEAKEGGLFHPQCRHAYSLYLAELAEG